MSKVAKFLDTDSVEFNPELNKILLEGVDDKTPFVEVFKKMDAIDKRVEELLEIAAPK